MIDKKEEIRLRFALGLQKAMRDKKITLRGLAANAGLEYTNVQRASVGKVNLALSTIVALAEGLEISPSKLLSYYERVSLEEVGSFGKLVRRK